MEFNVRFYLFLLARSEHVPSFFHVLFRPLPVLAATAVALLRPACVSLPILW